MVKISPSILAGNFLNLEDEIKSLEESKVDFIHYDIMDGVYVPNITFGIKFFETLKSSTTLPGDVHLMIINPERYIDSFIKVGADILTFHYETVKFPIRLANEIKKNGVKAGISINPSTPVGVLKDVIRYIDVVLLMSVEPGFYGQKFIEESYERVKELKHLIKTTNSDALIEIDGGVSLDNYKKLIDVGVDIFVIGNDFFRQQNRIEYVKIIKNYETK